MFFDPEHRPDSAQDDDETAPQGPVGESDEQVGQPFTYGEDDE